MVLLYKYKVFKFALIIQLKYATNINRRCFKVNTLLCEKQKIIRNRYLTN